MPTDPVGSTPFGGMPIYAVEDDDEAFDGMSEEVLMVTNGIAFYVRKSVWPMLKAELDHFKVH